MYLRREEYLRGAAGIGLGTVIKYLRQTTNAAEGNGLRTTISYVHGTASIGLGTTVKHNSRGPRYLVNKNAGAGNI
jgi:hypothetical protein